MTKNQPRSSTITSLNLPASPSPYVQEHPSQLTTLAGRASTDPEGSRKAQIQKGPTIGCHSPTPAASNFIQRHAFAVTAPTDEDSASQRCSFPSPKPKLLTVPAANQLPTLSIWPERVSSRCGHQWQSLPGIYNYQVYPWCTCQIDVGVDENRCQPMPQRLH